MFNEREQGAGPAPQIVGGPEDEKAKALARSLSFKVPLMLGKCQKCGRGSKEGLFSENYQPVTAMSLPHR